MFYVVAIRAVWGLRSFEATLVAFTSSYLDATVIHLAGRTPNFFE
jgi:hypothetical protein